MKTITVIINGKEIQAQVDDQELKKLEDKKNNRWRADEGGSYYYISRGFKNIGNYYERNLLCDAMLHEVNNYFKTKEEAEKKAGQLRAILVPETYIKGESFWIYDFVNEGPLQIFINNKYFKIHRKFSTKKEAQEWGDEFEKYFND